MRILKPICFVIIVILVGKVCGYGEKMIIDLVKYIIGFEILLNAKFIIKKNKNSIEFSIKIFTKN